MRVSTSTASAFTDTSSSCALVSIHAPHGQDLPDLSLTVRLGADNKNAVKQVNWQAVGTLELGAADAGLATVRRHDNKWRKLTLNRTVDEREALNVKHVDLVDEQNLVSTYARLGQCPPCLPHATR